MAEQPYAADDLEPLERLIAMWRDYTELHPSDDGFSRNAGFNSALQVCADQLAGVLRELRGEI